MVYFVTGAEGSGVFPEMMLIGTAREVALNFDRPYWGGWSNRRARLERRYSDRLVVREMEGDEATAAEVRAQLEPWRLGDADHFFWGPPVLAFVEARTRDWTGGDGQALGKRRLRSSQTDPVPTEVGLAGRLRRRRSDG